MSDPVVTWDDTGIVRCSAAPRHLDEVGSGPGEVRRLEGRLLLPGFVNAHSHAFQRAIRGHVQWRDQARGDFWTWRDAMYRAANALSPEGIEAVSRLAFLEMAEAGVTEVGEFHYLHHQPSGHRYDDPDELAERVIAAALDVGVRIVLLRVAYHRAGPGESLRSDQARFGARDPDEVLRAVARIAGHGDPRVRAGVAPHSVRAVPPEWLPEFALFAGPIHAHVAEQPAEVQACLTETGKSPLAVFHDAGLVDRRFSAVHLTFPSDGDVGLLQDAGGSVVVCPSTEMDLGDGFLPNDARTRLPLALGSDSHALIDLLQEARTLELHGRALAGRRHVLTPDDDDHGLAASLLRSTSEAGARALGGSGGRLEVGASADLVTLDLRRPAAAGVPPVVAAAMVADASWVDEVWVGGKRVVAQGRHPGRDAAVSAALPHIQALFS